jgi:hypothetical protein
MESFFESIFPFLVVAVFVGVRIISVARRLRNKRQQQKAAPVAPPAKTARGFVPWEDEFREAAVAGNLGESSAAQTASGADDDEAFSAWNLSVDDTLPAPVEPPAPKRLPEAPRPSLFAAAAKSAAQLPQPVPATPESSAQPLRPAPSPRPKQRFPKLPPLQQAVVWTEILGTPRGLQDGRFVNPE